jgi:Skp family chaperone for outer membrane proteins
MLSSVLNSDKAIDVNIAIIRTFVLVKQSVLDYKDLSENLKKLEKKSNKKFKEIFTALDYLITKKQEEDTLKNRQRIGFKPDKM